MKSVPKEVLSDLFEGIVAKRLTLVETVTDKSNQREFQGVKPLRKLFGDADRREIETQFIRFNRDESVVSESGFISWSNVRKGKPRAAEFHCYYNPNAVTKSMQIGDTLFIALRRDGKALVVVTPPNSTSQNQIAWLFGVSEADISGFAFTHNNLDRPRHLGLAARYVLDELGVETEDLGNEFDELIDRFGLSFPTTREFAQFARDTLGKEVDPRHEPDEVLVAWLEREEILFRRLERRVVADRLRSGFVSPKGEPNVDEFLSFSLSVQNRRKSRAGQSLELHLEALFMSRGLRFGRGVITENGNKPDFLFPGIGEYSDDSFPTARLTMLGAKSTLKDRWRQVLPEARRIEQKHLLTLEPGISQSQTDQMRAERLQLVVPKSLHETFRESQRTWLLSVSEFVALVEERQRD